MMEQTVMKQTALGILNSIIEPYKDNILSMELWGSSIIPYIKSPRDYDVFIIVKDIKSKKSLQEKIIKLYADPAFKEETKLCLHCRLLEEVGPYNDIYSYMSKWRQAIGEYKPITSVYDVLQDKKHFIEELKYYVDKYSKQDKPYIYKNWYHIYCVSQIIKNNSYELTEKQIEELNLIHDRAEGREKIIDELIKEINLWQI